MIYKQLDSAPALSNLLAKGTHNIMHQNKQGFTIVELLIVIVVIAILAAISVVAYNNVTRKANASAAKGNAENVQKVAEAYNADESKNTYPTYTELQNYTGYTRIPAGVSVINATLPTTSNGKITIGYKELGASPNFTGSCIAYYDYEAGDIAFVYAGAAKNAAVTGSTFTCS